MSEAEASARATATGKAVSVEAATTPTEVESANPDGTFTLTQNAAPVRKYADGMWKPLDATLVRRADGSVSPALTTGTLTLPGSGSRTLAVMKDGARTLSLTLPDAIGVLPAPSLSGPTATYADVLPGVDLTVTADDQGGFSETLVVKNASAAADPALRKLTFATQTNGVTPATDAAGNFTATDTLGRTVFSAPAPIMWDSATADAGGSAQTRAAITQGDTEEPSGSGVQVASTSLSPGAGAHVAPVKAVYTDSAGPGTASGTMALTPDAALLSGGSTVYPVYIDPSYAAGGSVQGWTYTSSYYHSSSFWKTKDSEGVRVGYNGWDSPYYKAHAFARMSVDSRIYGATIDPTRTHFYATEIHSASCTAEPVELWTTGAISSATTWDNEPAWKTKVDTQTVAHGWSSSCPAASVGWDTHTAMQAIANSPASSITLGLRAGDDGDKDQWKKFDPSTMTMTTTYDHKPATPTGLTTSPARACTGGVMGDGDITLYAGVSDPEGGTLSATFKVTRTSGGATVTTKTVNAVSGTKAAYTLTKANLESWLGTTTTTGLSWNLTASDGSYTSAPSTTCQFTFDPTRPGAPTVNDAVGTDCSESAANYQVGTAANFTLVPNSKGTTPDHYLYQLNGAAPVSAKTPDVTIKPTRGTNILNVTSVSPGGNIGDTATCVINASAAATAPDGDLTGDGVPDLTLVGGQAQLPPGLWLAHGAPNGQIVTAASQIGAQGTGVSDPGSTTDWVGTQAVTGHFATGNGFNDVLDYNPATGAGWVLYGNGDGSALSPASGHQADIDPLAFTDPITGLTADAVANGGGFNAAVNGGDFSGYPDLLLIIDGTLSYEASFAQPGTFVGVEDAQPITASNPADGGDWTGWQITTSLVHGLPALFARSGTGGPVYYYSPDDLTDLAQGNPATAVSLGMSTSSALLQAADLNHDGTPDLWQTDAVGNVTADLLDLGITPPKITTQAPQKVATGTHEWRLDDATDGNATNAADGTGTPALPLTASPNAGAGVTWDSGDLFDPDLQLNGTAYLQTAGKAVDLTGSLTVSVWAEPTTLGGAVFSQNGGTYSGIKLIPTAAGWQFSLNSGAGTAGTYDTVTGGAVHLGTWTHLTATYDKAVKVMNLYVDEVFVATGGHTAPSTGAAGNFVVGANQNNGASPTGYFSGHLSDIQTWTGAAIPPTQASTPASYHQAITSTRILDTRYASGLANTSGVTAGTATIAADSVTSLRIAGDTVTSTAGTPVTVPSSVTAVAIDVTAVNQTASGYVTAYADSSQRPITSSTNFTAASTTTGYQIVPVGADGKIDLFTHGSAIALVVDMTGYFTTDPALPGNQTYTPLAPATRALDTRTSTANTNLTSTGTVPGDSTFTLTIAGVDGVPSDAAAVAINLTTADATGSGYLQAYATGAAPAAATSLSYDTSSALASMAADTPIGTSGTITISNHHSATAVLVDIAGYYTDATDGQTYHPVNPTRLVDTRNGTGGTGQPIPAYTTYTLAQADVQQITTATTPTLALMLTEATATAAGHADAYPAGTAANNTSNLDWAAGAINANLALTPTSAGSEISVDNHSNGTLDLVIDCSGYFSR
ncbi:LamG domain-containing protein [Actinacidiphila epipremni]|uniref:LamG domain-containing protein n=1 Tax=Actinacidiphila epipremni TaxID=2053013 RepID=A0ABX0ZQA8_9ACTN|nr:LamG domain-containing protein [Actinacidiphila epipremni]NJP44757.1 LamG domain-containing protein [Actinacidiphila epipremni]